MTPIPFDLKRAKAGDQILINGGPGTFGAHNANASKFSRVVLWDSAGAAWAVSDEGFGTSGMQLVAMAPKKQAFWVNVYPLSFGSDRYETKEQADRGAGRTRIACVRVEFTEGEGL